MVYAVAMWAGRIRHEDVLSAVSTRSHVLSPIKGSNPVYQKK